MAALILAIETSNPSSRAPGEAGDVALGEWDGLRASVQRILSVEAVRSADRHEDDLAAAIGRVFTHAGAPRAEVRRVVVSVGPGGFTAVRIAVATGQMIAEALGAQAVGVPSADVAAASAPATWRRFCVALTSKRGTAYIAAFERRADAAPIALPSPGVMGPEEMQRLRASHPLDGLLADAHLDPAIRDWAERTRLPIAPPIFSAEVCLRLGARGEPVDPSRLLPIYPREPEAVTKWRELRAPGTKP